MYGDGGGAFNINRALYSQRIVHVPINCWRRGLGRYGSGCWHGHLESSNTMTWSSLLHGCGYLSVPRWVPGRLCVLLLKASFIIWNFDTPWSSKGSSQSNSGLCLAMRLSRKESMQVCGLSLWYRPSLRADRVSDSDWAHPCDCTIPFL